MYYEVATPEVGFVVTLSDGQLVKRPLKPAYAKVLFDLVLLGVDEFRGCKLFRLFVA